MMKQFTKIHGTTFAERSIKRLQSMCRELNEFWNCNTGCGTLGYRTSSARNNNWNKWLCKIT
jgi:hypothetical protein